MRDYILKFFSKIRHIFVQIPINNMTQEIIRTLKKLSSAAEEALESWENLTNAQILAWNALAQTQAGKSVLGTASKITGANLYTRLNYWIVQTDEKSGEMLATVKLG